mgnify:CR=1 FL=1
MSGVDMKTILAMAGHSKASATSDFYSHFLKNSDVHASEIINKIFEKNASYFDTTLKFICYYLNVNLLHENT